MLKKNKYNKKLLAFTVLEMLVVISIITLLFALFMVNFRNVDKRQLLETETDKILSVLKQAQIYSLTGQTYNGIRYNYGVRLSNCASGACTYILYGDPPENNYIYNEGEENNGGKIRDILTGISISDVSPDLSGNVNITFEAPLGNIYFNGEQVVDEASFVLTNIAGTSRTITINRLSGKIQGN